MKQKYNVLVIGSGGRENAIAWKCSVSNKIRKLYIAPGNAGTATIGENTNVDIKNFKEIKEVINEKNINIVIIGPEEPLVNGIVDYLQKELKKEVYIVGPTKEASMLEGSKAFAKQFMLKYNIPTAPYHIVNKNNIDNGVAFLKSIAPPYVIKADGLAGGKGVYIVNDLNEAIDTLKEFLAGKFGKASEVVVLEKFLKGKEVSFFALVNERNFVVLPEAKDYKKVGEGDTGLNTGGMGSVSPVSFVTNEIRQKINTTIIHRTIYGLIKENIRYKGIIYFGLLIDENNNPYVIEYNVRLGDPEAQVILPRIENDFIDLIENVIIYQQPVNIKVLPEYYVGVVLASKGYPQEFEVNKKIIINTRDDDSLLFFAGAKKVGNEIYTSGGRVVTVVSHGQTLKDSKEKVYNTISKIHFDNLYYRTDIGYDLF
ncbi:MAG: phosphoribosylamine--glycine ligase [Bacteroidales bacterium]|nr:phosphoribosylamine--glycine ligase [Bacteroidales bacterium]